MTRIPAILLVFLAMGMTARADDWNRQYSVSGRPELHLSTGDGSVEFAVSEGKQVGVSVHTEGWNIGPDGVRIEEHQSGDRIEVTIHTQQGASFCFFCRRLIHVDLHLPPEANLDLHTGDGSIRGSRVRGNLYVNTGDGSIVLENVGGQLSAHSGDGSIRVDGQFASLKVETGDGSIHAEVDRGSKMEGSWYLHSGDGSIELRLPEDLSADLDARTGDGSIRSELSALDHADTRRNSLRGKLNGGGPLLELRSGDGSIRLLKN